PTRLAPSSAATAKVERSVDSCSRRQVSPCCRSCTRHGSCPVSKSARVCWPRRSPCCARPAPSETRFGPSSTPDASNLSALSLLASPVDVGPQVLHPLDRHHGCRLGRAARLL